MSRARRLLAAVLVAIALPVVPAVAEHEVYYRFTVLGYVKDVQGQPIADATVEVTRDKTAFSYLGQTDAEGFYFVRARLGDESRGEVLTVQLPCAGGQLPAHASQDAARRLAFDLALTQIPRDRLARREPFVPGPQSRQRIGVR